MAAPKGNQYAVGSRKGNRGRRGYEFEKAQFNRMKKLLNGILGLGEKILGGTAGPEDVKRFETLLKLNLKIMDKIHANKVYLEGELETKLPYNMIVQEFDGKREI